MKLINYFERVYIVNLPERVDRRREIEHELQRIGLSVDGQHIRYFRAIRPESAGLFPSLGARGCFMSHLEILREAKRDGLDNILVMEDDLTMDPRLGLEQPEMLTRLQNGSWDILYLGHVESTPDAIERPALRISQIPMATTHFYALNRQGIATLLEHLEACLTRLPGHPMGSPMHVDGAYSLLRSLQPGILTLMAVPSLGGQRSSRSDIYPNKWYDRAPMLKQMAAIARNIKNCKVRSIQPAD